MRCVMFFLIVPVAGLSSGVVAAEVARAATAGKQGRNRIVRVVTVDQGHLSRGSNALLEDTLSRLNLAASFRPDIACLPELFSNRPPETVSGPVTRRLAAWAREHSSYIVFGLRTKTNDRIHNSALLIDRKGQIVGQYNKGHPTEDEIRDGTIPGEGGDPPVFQTDFGTIAIQICFDVNWREGWKRLKERGAKIVFFPSAYPAARQLPALALLNQYYIVSSAMTGSSSIYDITGEVLASSGKYQSWAGACLPIGKRLFEIDYNVEKAREIQQKYGPKVEVVWFHDSDWFTLASLDPDLTVEELISTYGLTPLDEYIARATRAINSARSDAAKGNEPAK